MKKHSEIFENAVTKLYNAFHSGELNYGDCTKCAIGNLCNNESEWADVFCGITKDVITVEEQIRFSSYKDYAKELIDKTGYSVLELANIEFKFMMGGTNGTETSSPSAPFDNFKGLCAVIEYLCELEGIPNIMDYQKLFETEHKPLESVFA